MAVKTVESKGTEPDRQKGRQTVVGPSTVERVNTHRITHPLGHRTEGWLVREPDAYLVASPADGEQFRVVLREDRRDRMGCRPAHECACGESGADPYDYCTHVRGAIALRSLLCDEECQERERERRRIREERFEQTARRIVEAGGVEIVDGVAHVVVGGKKHYVSLVSQKPLVFWCTCRTRGANRGEEHLECAHIRAVRLYFDALIAEQEAKRETERREACGSR